VLDPAKVMSDVTDCPCTVAGAVVFMSVRTQ
jgi:hypothetical protein